MKRYKFSKVIKGLDLYESSTIYFYSLIEIIEHRNLAENDFLMISCILLKAIF